MQQRGFVYAGAAASSEAPGLASSRDEDADLAREYLLDLNRRRAKRRLLAARKRGLNRNSETAPNLVLHPAPEGTTRVGDYAPVGPAPTVPTSSAPSASASRKPRRLESYLHEKPKVKDEVEFIDIPCEGELLYKVSNSKEIHSHSLAQRFKPAEQSICEALCKNQRFRRISSRLYVFQ